MARGSVMKGLELMAWMSIQREIKWRVNSLPKCRFQDFQTNKFPWLFQYFPPFPSIFSVFFFSFDEFNEYKSLFNKCTSIKKSGEKTD